jgi:hypothetical protein
VLGEKLTSSLLEWRVFVIVMGEVEAGVIEGLERKGFVFHTLNVIFALTSICRNLLRILNLFIHSNSS